MGRLILCSHKLNIGHATAEEAAAVLPAIQNDYMEYRDVPMFVVLPATYPEGRSSESFR